MPKPPTVIGEREAGGADKIEGVPKSISLHDYRLDPQTKYEDLIEFLKPRFPEVTEIETP
ncbi:hypothetical protein C0J52_13959 [Blattella germanica]|nr:hypothetical protein C0J52_13959 [Blattella germanica]